MCRNDVYFLLWKRTKFLKLILESLRASNAFWHSLGVFTTADFTDVTKDLTLEKIKEICLSTELVMIGAYDGEGYVFWEKNLTNENKGFFTTTSDSS